MRTLHLLPLLLPVLINAQNPEFGWDHINQHIYSPENGALDARGPDELYVVQESGSSNAQVLLRFDRETGDTLWSVALDTMCVTFGVKVVGTDGVLVGGANTVRYDIARFSHTGEVVWHHHVDLGSGDNWEEGGFVCDAQENTYFTWYEGDPSEHTHLIKLDAEGNLLWEYVYEPNFLDNHPQQIRLDNQANILVGGTRKYNSMPFDSKAFLLKIDPEGALLWDTTFVDGSYYNNVNDILVLPDDRILVSVSNSTGDIDAGSVVAYSADGNELWSWTGDPWLKPWLWIENDQGSGQYLLAVDAQEGYKYLMKFGPGGEVLMDAQLSGIGSVRDIVRIADHRMLLAHLVPGGGGFTSVAFTALDTLGNADWTLTQPSTCFDCFPASPWPLVAADPSHVYTVGTKYVGLSEYALTLEIDIPCVPDVVHCLDPAYMQEQLEATEARLGELHNDGYTDLLTTVNSAQTLLVHRNTAGTFALEQTIELPFMGGGIRVADLNGDGWNDVVVAEDIGGHLMILQNNGGSLNYVDALDAGFPLAQLELGDADGVNGPDAFVRYFAGPMNEVHVFRNNGSGVFDAQPVVRSLPDVALHMATADVDQDGMEDLAVIGWNTFGKLYRALGAGAYGSELDISNMGSCVNFRDVNDDGWNDVVVAGPGLATIGMNQSGSGFQDLTWELPGLGDLGVPHPFPGDTSTRYFLPDLANEELGLLAWSECANGPAPFLLTNSGSDVMLFAEDVTGDAGVDLLAFTPVSGDLWIAPNCDHNGGVFVPEQGHGGTAPQLSIRPDPASGSVLVLPVEQANELVVLDALGRTVMQFGMKGRSAIMLPFEERPNGIYVVIAHGNQEHRSATFTWAR